MNRSELLEKANNLPVSSGVYIMHGEDGTVIYVGKSKKLKNRVSQYFSLSHKDVKTAKMASSVCDFDVILCDSEIEALTLENILIKKHTPRYNIKLKDCKSYPYIKVTVGDEYPRVFMTRKRESDGARYFGPYSGTSVVYNVLDTIKKTLHIVDCKHTFPRDIGRIRPCIYKQMNRCVGVCTGDVSAEEYKKIIGDALVLLGGNIDGVKKRLSERMQKLAEEERFEAAAVCRDSVSSLERLLQKQKVASDPKAEHDFFALYCGDIASCISVVSVRGGALCAKEDYLFNSGEIIDEAAMSAFLCDYYIERDYIPKSVELSFDLPAGDSGLLESFLCEKSGRKITVHSPKRGELRSLCKLAEHNAEQKIKQYAEDVKKRDDAPIKLAKLLALEVVPERIEAYDISNIGKEHIICGMVVFENGLPKKTDYRVFNIKNEGIDDYAAMREALTRRFSHLGDNRFGKTPDLILLDGGKGHVNTVREAVNGEYSYIPIFGMVKDDYHKTRALTDGDADISIATDGLLYAFIYRIQEEVHRFAKKNTDNAKRKSLTGKKATRKRK